MIKPTQSGTPVPAFSEIMETLVLDADNAALAYSTYISAYLQAPTIIPFVRFSEFIRSNGNRPPMADSWQKVAAIQLRCCGDDVVPVSFPF